MYNSHVYIYIYGVRALSFGRAAYYRFTLYYVLLLSLWGLYVLYGPTTRDDDSGILQVQRSRENTSRKTIFFFCFSTYPFYIIFMYIVHNTYLPPVSADYRNISRFRDYFSNT